MESRGLEDSKIVKTLLTFLKGSSHCLKISPRLYSYVNISPQSFSFFSKIEDAARLRVQYLLAMSQKEFIHQQLNLQKFIRGRIRWRRGFRRRRIWRRAWLNPVIRAFGRLVELQRDDHSAFKKFSARLLNSTMKSLRGSEEESIGSTHCLGSH